MGRNQQPKNDIEDEESDISEDPFLNGVNADIESVDKKNDNKLLVGLLLFVPLAITYEQFVGKSVWFMIIGVVVIVALIAFTIFKCVVDKQKVAAKYGLVCPACGYKPRAHMGLSAAQTLRCAKWGVRLNGRE